VVHLLPMEQLVVSTNRLEFYNGSIWVAFSNESIITTNTVIKNINTFQASAKNIITLNQQDLLYYFNFSDNTSYPGSGTSVFDLSPNGYSATLVNGTSFSNNYQGSVVLDGIDDYISTDILVDRNDFTIAAWVVINQYPTLGNIINTFDGDSDEWIALYISNNGKVRFPLDNNTNKVDLEGTTTLNLNQIYFLTATFSRSTRSMKIYVNGTLDASATHPINSTIAKLNNTRFGAQATGINELFDGNILQVFEYSRELDANEVLDALNNTNIYGI